MSQLMEKPNADADVPEGINVMHIMDASGDTRIMWDPTVPAEVDTARAAYDAAKKKGMTAYSVLGDGAKGEVLRRFSADQAKIIMVPQLAGG